MILIDYIIPLLLKEVVCSSTVKQDNVRGTNNANVVWMERLSYEILSHILKVKSLLLKQYIPAYPIKNI